MEDDIINDICRVWIACRKKTYSAFQKQIINKRILLLLYAILKNKEKCRRQYWVRPIFREERRLMQGASDNLVREMEDTDVEKYFNYFRMPFETFQKLLTIIVESPVIDSVTVPLVPFRSVSILSRVPAASSH